MPENEPLTFEQFIEKDTRGKSRYNNFILYFINSNFCEQVMRDAQHYRTFKKECPDLESMLRKEVNLRSLRSLELEAHDPLAIDLYAAYLIMRNYGAQDGELIGKI